MERALRILRAPGTRSRTECAAPTQIVLSTDPDDQEKGPDMVVENITTYTAVVKPGLLDQWLDKVVETSGSELVFFTIFIALLTWALMGIRFGNSNTWQIVISDVQAIVNMVFDAFLMRQQLNSYESHLIVAGCLRSRSCSQQRMLKQLIASGKYKKIQPKQFQELVQTDFTPDLPAENWLGRISTAVAWFSGHIVTVFAFWVCIAIWLAFGPHLHWSNTWQLYINSATSALMVFLLAFIANIRERHTKYMTKCLESIWKVDAALETKLRTVSGDKIENPSIVIPPVNQTRIQRVIDYYADLVGTLAGIAILSFVIVVWLAIGPVLHFDSNWWLLIGTYAGLIGLNDGFILRNVSTVVEDYEDEQFIQLQHDDMDVLDTIVLGDIEEEQFANNSFTYRISVRVGDICAHEWTVVLGVILIFGLIIGSSAMRWTVTGQLLCNVPPSIIESFFTMILLTGHNIGETKRRVHLYNLYLRRLKLVSYVDTMTKTELVEVVSKLEIEEKEIEEVEIEEKEVEVCNPKTL